MDEKSMVTDDLNSISLSLNDIFEDTEYVVPLTSALNIDSRKKLEALFVDLVKQFRDDKNLKKYLENVEEIFSALNLVLENEERLLNTLENIQINEQERQIYEAFRQETSVGKRESRSETELSLKQESSNRDKSANPLLNDLKVQYDKLLDNNTKLLAEYDQLSKRYNDLEMTTNENEHIRDEYKSDMERNLNEITTLKLEIQRLNRRLESSERENKHLSEKFDEKNNISSTNLNEMKTFEAKLKQSEATIKELNSNQEKLRKELNVQSIRFQKLKQDHDVMQLRYDEQMLDNKQLASELKQAEVTTQAFQNEYNQVLKNNETLGQKLSLAKESELETKSRDRFRMDKINDLEKNLKMCKEKCFTQERDAQKQKTEFVKSLALLAKSRNQIKKQLKNIQILKEDVDRAKSENENIKLEMTSLKKHLNEEKTKRENRDRDVKELTDKLIFLIDDLKSKEITSTMLGQKLNDSLSKIRHITKLYEGVRGDRNFNAQKLIEFKEDNVEMRNQVAMLNNEQLHLTKSKLRSENEVTSVKIELKKIEHQRDKLRGDVDGLTSDLKNSNKLVSNLSKEHKGLLKLVEASDADKRTVQNELEKLSLERNTLGSQLIRRNDEISLLYEKIKILEATLSRGKRMYDERCEEIGLLRSEILRLRRNEQLHSRVCNETLIRDCQKELLVSEKVLIKEQAKVKALEDSRTSWYIHRWRNIQIADSTQYELIAKCNYLQKRLICKCKQLSQLELNMQEQQLMFKNMEKFVQRRLTFNETQQLVQDYEKKLKEKTKKIQSLLAENSMLTEKAKLKIKS